MNWTAHERQYDPRRPHLDSSFARLRSFYESDSDLADAVGFDRGTVRSWRTRVPVRPREDNRQTILCLLFVCVHAKPYLRHPHDVGRWTLTSLPTLVGDSPAELVRRLGKDGADQVVETIIDHVPGVELTPAVELDDDEVRHALVEGLGEKAVQQAEAFFGRYEPGEVSDEDMAEFEN